MLLRIIRNGKILETIPSELRAGDIFVQFTNFDSSDKLESVKTKLIQEETTNVSDNVVITRDEYMKLEEGGLQIKVTQSKQAQDEEEEDDGEEFSF